MLCAGSGLLHIWTQYLLVQLPGTSFLIKVQWVVHLVFTAYLDLLTNTNLGWKIHYMYCSALKGFFLGDRTTSRWLPSSFSSYEIAAYVNLKIGL